MPWKTNQIHTGFTKSTMARELFKNPSPAQPLHFQNDGYIQNLFGIKQLVILPQEPASIRVMREFNNYLLELVK